MPPELEVPAPLHSPSSATVVTPAPEAQPTVVATPEVKTDDISTLPESWQAEIKSLRKESADRRTKLSAYEKAEEDRKAATLSDIEKANESTVKAEARAAALEAKLVQRDALSALSAANLIDSEIAYLVIKDRIEIIDGEATNIADLVADLIKAKPHLVKAEPTKPTAPDTKPTNPSPTPTAPRGKAPGRI